MTAPSYKSLPQLAGYIDRVGAEEMNFRRFMVKEYRGHYYIERVLIRIKEDGSVYCSNKDYAPTKEEAEAIKIAVANAGWPRSIAATPAQRRKLKVDGATFDFVDVSGEIVMVQERTEIKGQKAYVPWTFWSDGDWRRMEPDGLLPFWRPRPQAEKSRIMIHEGAKAAKAAHEIAADHPWAKELSEYEHWGMIGGALAPHRADYAQVRQQKPVEVVYVCDNDFPGNSALKEVSRNYGGSMKGVMFDSRWKPGWDIADPMPEAMFSKTGRYLGPTMAQLTIGATWATEIVPVSKAERGRPSWRVTSAFREEWLHCVSPEVFIHRDWSNRILTKEEFNSTVRPFSDADDTARLLKSDVASKSAVIQYKPGNRSGIYASKQGRFINTHQESSVKADAAADIRPWHEFLEHLFPVKEDRLEMMRWIATLVASPSVKMGYGVLLISEVQGVGKGTLGEKILRPLVGEDNVSFPSESEIVDSPFNYWLAHKRLAVVHEIYAGHSAKAYNKLKSIITDRIVSVNKKHQAAYEVENWIHIFACSNSPRAIQLSADDRRWFVPVVTDQKRDQEYWTELNRWLSDDGGLSAIMQWAKAHKPRVSAGQSSPESVYKKQIILEGYSPGMELIDDVLETIEEAVSGGNAKVAEAIGIKNGHAALFDVALVDLIRTKIHDGRNVPTLEKAQTLRKIARARGWTIGKERIRTGPLGRKENDRATVLYFGRPKAGIEFDSKGKGLDFVNVAYFSTL
jgi:hypothetical protein